MAPSTRSRAKFKLPFLVTGPVEIGRLMRELDKINEEVLQSSLRSEGQSVAMSLPSQLLEATLEINQLDINKEQDRLLLAKNLAIIKQRAPVVHMSFGADPPVDFIEKIMEWLRAEIHPFMLLTIGLQPTIGAGCILRTNNKYFDMSLKQDFASKKEMLAKLVTVKAGANL